MPQQIVIAEQLRIAAVLNDERVDELIVAQGRHQIGDVNETVFFALADVDESGIDAWEDVFNGAQIDITDLVTTLRND